MTLSFCRVLDFIKSGKDKEMQYGTFNLTFHLYVLDRLMMLSSAYPKISFMKLMFLIATVLLSLSLLAQQKREARTRGNNKPVADTTPIIQKPTLSEDPPIAGDQAGSNKQANPEQPYTTAVGGKLSSGLAFSYKKFISQKNAVEVQAMFFKEGLRFIGLYEFHFPIEGVNNLSWYVGPGVHVGVYRSKYKTINATNNDVGIDGVVGLDYKIANSPINISLDWQPSFSVLGNAGLQPQFGGLAVRFVLN